MATLTKAITKNFIDGILPIYGTTPRIQLPIWDNSQKMFICDQYESKNGHLYYRGIRFCERIVIVEKVGLYYNWTYIDCIELYAFNGHKMELIQKRDYEKVFRNEEFIRKESELMVANYLSAITKTQHISLSDEQIVEHATELINGCYKSFLDPDYNTRLTQILPKLEQR